MTALKPAASPSLRQSLEPHVDLFKCFYLIPTEKRGTCPPKSLESKIAAAKSRVEAIFEEQFQILQALKGYRAQLPKPEAEYGAWKKQIEALNPRIAELRVAIFEAALDLPNLKCDQEGIAQATKDVGLLALKICFLEIINIEVFPFLDGPLHVSALKLYKEMMRDCNALVADVKKPLDAKIKEFDELVLRALDTAGQQKGEADHLDKSKKLLKRDVTRLHRRALEYVLYVLTHFRALLGQEPQEAEAKKAWGPPARTLARIERSCKTLLEEKLILAQLNKMSLAHVDNDQVEQYLTDTDGVVLKKAESFRPKWWDPSGRVMKWWYGDIGDGQVVGALGKVAHSIVKLYSHLETLLSNIVQGALTPAQQTGFDKSFCKRCVVVLDDRLRAQEELLYNAPFNPNMHTGIYDIDLREARLYQIRTQIGCLTQLAFGTAFRPTAEAQRLFISYLTPSPDRKAQEYETSYEAVDRLFNLVRALAILPPPSSKPKGHIDYLRSVTLTPICQTVANFGARSLRLIGIQETLIDDIIAGKPLQAIMKDDSLTMLPEEVQSALFKEMLRHRPFSQKATHPKLDLCLYALANNPIYAHLYRATVQVSSSFRERVHLCQTISQSNLAENRTGLGRFCTLFRCLGEIDLGFSSRIGAAKNFVRYVQARQMLIEVKQMKVAEFHPPEAMQRFEELSKEAELRLQEIETHLQYPKEFADTLTQLPGFSNAGINVIPLDQAARCLYKQLTLLLYSTAESEDLKRGVEKTVHNVLSGYKPQEILALFNDIDAPNRITYSILLYRFLIDSLIKVDLDNPHLSLSPREFNLLRHFLGNVRQIPEARALWIEQYDLGTLEIAFRTLLKLESKYQTKEHDPELLAVWNDQVQTTLSLESCKKWSNVVDYYRIFKLTLNNRLAIQRETQDHNILSQQLMNANGELNGQAIPEERTHPLWIADWCRKEMDKKLREIVVDRV